MSKQPLKEKDDLVKTNRNDFKICNLTEEIVLNRIEWQDRSHVGNPVSFGYKAL